MYALENKKVLVILTRERKVVGGKPKFQVRIYDQEGNLEDVYA
jgi:hypothetical protein